MPGWELFRKYPWVPLFAAFIAVTACWDMLETSRAESDLENRKLAQKPKLSWESLMEQGEKSYDQKFDAYINDQFIGRDGWITIKSVSEMALGKQENNGVVFGKDGYLFRKFDSLDSSVPGRYEENTGYLREFCGMYPDAPITMMIVPTAYSILSDKLPNGLQLVDQREELARLYDSLPEDVGTLSLFDTLDAHREEQLYYRTDHHWTTYGAYLAAQAFAAQKGRELPALDTLTAHASEGFYGTNFATAKKIDTPADTLVYYDIPVTSVTVSGEEKGGLYDPAPLEKRDQYATFLWGNNNRTVITSENNRYPASDGHETRILLIKDSYGNCFAPFLTYLYDVVDIVDVRFLNGLSDILAEREYDDVLVLYNFETLASDPYMMRLRY